MQSFNEHVKLLVERASIVQSILRGEVVARQIINEIKDGRLNLKDNTMSITLKGFRGKGKESVNALKLNIKIKAFNNYQKSKGVQAFFKATNQSAQQKEGTVELYLFEIFGQEMGKNYRGNSTETLNKILMRFVESSNTHALVSTIQHELLHAHSFRRELQKHLIIKDDDNVEWSVTNVSHLTAAEAPDKMSGHDEYYQSYYNIPDEIMAHIAEIVTSINQLWIKQVGNGTLLARNSTESINRQIDFAIRGFPGFPYLTDENKKKFRQKMYSTVMGLWEKYKKVAEEQEKA